MTCKELFVHAFYVHVFSIETGILSGTYIEGIVPFKIKKHVHTNMNVQYENSSL